MDRKHQLFRLAETRRSAQNGASPLSTSRSGFIRRRRIGERPSILDRLTTWPTIFPLPGSGADLTRNAVRGSSWRLAAYGFFPIYETDIVEIDPGAVRLGRNIALR